MNHSVDKKADADKREHGCIVKKMLLAQAKEWSARELRYPSPQQAQ